jgi:hypothetical protein
VTVGEFHGRRKGQVEGRDGAACGRQVLRSAVEHPNQNGGRIGMSNVDDDVRLSKSGGGRRRRAADVKVCVC